MKRWGLVILLLLIMATLAGAQQKNTLQQYSTENGLPSNGIKGIQFDTTTGFLWIATEAGLIRFNGAEFKTFETGTARQVITNRMHNLLRSNAGDIYAQDVAGTIYKIKRQTPFYIDGSGRLTTIYDISFSLLASEKLYNRHKAPVIKLNINTSLGYDKVLPYTDTVCYIIKDGSLYHYSASDRDSLAIPLAIPYLSNGFILNKNYFLVDSAGAVYTFNPATRETSLFNTPRISKKTGVLIWENGMQNPILFAGKKAFALTYENKQLTQVLICDSIPENLTIKFAQYYEPAKTLFIGTESNGIYVARNYSLETILNDLPGHNQGKAFYGQVLLPNGNIISNGNQQLGKNKVAPDTTMKGATFYQLLQEGDSVVWYVKTEKYEGVNINQCLHQYNLITKKLLIYYKVSLGGQCPMVRSQGRLYFFTRSGLSVLSGDTLVYIDKKIPNNETGLAYNIKEISPGVLALACCNYLLRYDIRKHYADTLLTVNDGCIRALWEYKGYLFIGTYGKGMYIWKNGIVKPLPLDRNKYLLFAHCFVKDVYGYCWISSNKGLFKARLTDMIDAYEKDLPDVYYHHYGKDDGMYATSEMNGGCIPCAVELQNRIISFPTMSGLIWVDPTTVKPALSWKELYIDRFTVNKTSFNPDSLAHVELPTNSNDIEINVAFPVWENRENIYIKYRIDDDSAWKWIDPASSHISLMNLSFGNHVLLIRKLNGFGVNNVTDLDLPFAIRTPWHKRWWFYLLVGIVALGLIYLYLQLRTRQYKIRQVKLEGLVADKTQELQAQNSVLEKRDAVKTRLISIINHDIITPLRFMTVTGKSLIEKKKVISEEIRDETISEMVHTSGELQSLATNMLNWIKYQTEGRSLLRETFFIHDLPEKVLYVLGPVAKLKKITVVNAVEKNIEVHQAFEPLRILLYNLVSNAINFSEKGTITISSKVDGPVITLSVSDQGVGLKEEQVQDLLGGTPVIHGVSAGTSKGHGLGYLIIRDLLKLTDSTMKIDSKQGVGTTIMISFRSQL